MINKRRDFSEHTISEEVEAAAKMLKRCKSGGNTGIVLQSISDCTKIPPNHIIILEK
jgi:hypothetical protein